MAASGIKRFQTTSLFDLYLRPRKNFKLNPQVHFLKYSDQFALLNNDRMSYGFSGNYHNTNYHNLNLGFNLQREIVTTGNRYENTSMSVNFGISTRRRSSFHVSYGTNNNEYPNVMPLEETARESRSTNLILQMHSIIRTATEATDHMRNIRTFIMYSTFNQFGILIKRGTYEFKS